MKRESPSFSYGEHVKSEDAIIREFYPSEGAKCLRRLPGRDSPASLNNRAMRLGVSAETHGRNPKLKAPDVQGRIAELRAMLEQFNRVDPHSPYAAEAKRRLQKLGA